LTFSRAVPGRGISPFGALPRAMAEGRHRKPGGCRAGGRFRACHQDQAALDSAGRGHTRRQALPRELQVARRGVHSRGAAAPPSSRPLMPPPNHPLRASSTWLARLSCSPASTRASPCCELGHGSVHVAEKEINKPVPWHFAVLCDFVGGQNGPIKNVDKTFWQKP
jgi:hypothetical protein